LNDRANRKETQVDEKNPISDESIMKFKAKLTRDDFDSLSALLNQGLNLFVMDVKLPEGMLAQVNAFLLLQMLSERGEVVSTIPDGEAISNGDLKGRLLILTAQRSDKDILETLKNVGEIEADFTPVLASKLGITTTPERRFKAKRESEGIEALIRKLEKSMRRREMATISKRDFSHRMKLIKEVKVSVEDLDRIFTLVGELVLIRNRLHQISEDVNLPALRELVKYLSHVTNELSKIRLTSIGQVLKTFSKFISDLAERSGKKIDLLIEGEEVSVDRMILEELLGPLKSLIGNAVVHGIESPEERIAKGKSAVGTIKIAAERSGNFTTISIEDDGRGIDLDLVKETAVKRGFISRSMAERMGDTEALNLIFLPGFTTKKEHPTGEESDMGLNSVKQSIEALGGIIEVQSEKDKGTRFNLMVPTNVSLLTTLLVEVGGEVYAIPSFIVRYIFKLEPSRVKHLGKQPAIIHEDAIVPLYSLSNLLGLPRREDRYGIVMRRGGRLYAVSVSTILGMEDVIVKPVDDEKMLRMPWLTNFAILSNGKIILVIDPYHMLEGELNATSL